MSGGGGGGQEEVIEILAFASLAARFKSTSIQQVSVPIISIDTYLTKFFD